MVSSVVVAASIFYFYFYFYFSGLPVRSTFNKKYLQQSDKKIDKSEKTSKQKNKWRKDKRWPDLYSFFWL